MFSKRKSFQMFAASLVAIFFVGALPWRELKADANTHGEYELSPLSVVYDQTSGWGTTTQGEFVITNESEGTVESWTLEIEFAAELQISNLWNGQDLSTETTPSNVLVIGNEVYNATILPGESVSFGLIVTGTEFAPVAPASVSIYSEDEQIEEVEPTEETTEETEVTESEVTPTVTPTVSPSATPTVTPTVAPTEEPTATPTVTTTTEPGVTPIPTEETEDEPEPVDEIDPDLDSDGDTLSDVYEIEIGTNPNDTDSDGDGIYDCLELIIEYDPTSVDSDGDRILDGNEDYDNDGISNINEIILGTTFVCADSDYDGILDGEEVDVYGTDPMNNDTDGDGIPDGDELAIGKDPLNASDRDNRITQSNTTSIGNADSTAITSVDVSVDLTGSIDSSFSVTDAYNVDVYSTNVAGRIGSPITIASEESFDSADVTIHYSESSLDGVAETDLAILWYDEELGHYVEQDQAILDSSNNALSLEINNSGSYVVVSRSQWHSVTTPSYTEDDIVEVVAHDIDEDTRYDFYIFLERDLSPAAERNIYNLYVNLVGNMRDGDTIHLFTGNGAFVSLPYQDNMRDYIPWVNYWLQTRDGTQATEVRGAISCFENNVRTTYTQRNRLQSGNIPVLFLVQNCADQECLDRYDEERVSDEFEICYIAPSEAYAASSSRVNGCRYTCYSDTPDIWSWYFGDQDPYYCDNLNFYWETLDRDHDGLPNVLEEDGMLGTNGNVYYSDPDMADTDGDGISDRDEMGEMYTIQRHNDTMVIVNGVAYLISWLEDSGLGFLTQFIPENELDISYVFDVESDPSNSDSDFDTVIDSKDGAFMIRDPHINYLIYSTKYIVELDDPLQTAKNAIVNQQFQIEVACLVAGYIQDNRDYKLLPTNSIAEFRDNWNSMGTNAAGISYIIDEVHIICHGKLAEDEDGWSQYGFQFGDENDAFSYNACDENGVFYFNDMHKDLHICNLYIESCWGGRATDTFSMAGMFIEFFPYIENAYGCDSTCVLDVDITSSGTILTISSSEDGADGFFHFYRFNGTTTKTRCPNGVLQWTI